MINYLIHRPVSVIMTFTALFLVGIISYINIPVTLLPDISIPEISIQVQARNTSARELENISVSKLRQHLMQVSKLRDIHSETRDGSAVILLSFEYGANTDLAFIEVNEKIDAVMNFLPREMERPKVIKANATDIPVFNINLTLSSDSSFAQTDIERFTELSDFAENIVRQRIEQLPQVAMVDMSGRMKKNILITPDKTKLEISGINMADIDAALGSNNVDPGTMTVKDGHYEYVIRFSSVLRTLDDIRNIYIRKNDRIYQLNDLAAVEIVPAKEDGMAIYDGKRSVVLSVIKQSDVNMNSMQIAVDNVLKHLKKDYPSVAFHITQSQTELLEYTISNLQQNLILAFLFVFLVSVFFLKDGKSSVIIGICLVVSLSISLLIFFLCHISINVVSLTGLILASGNMIDNAIVVTDNIGQYRKIGRSVSDSCIKGANEVSASMLSSVLTNICVFLPLIFMSGIAGAVFFDQAFSVTVGLVISYITSITLLPVLYKLTYSLTLPALLIAQRTSQKEKTSIAEKIYHRGINWIFSHKLLTLAIMLITSPLCLWLFVVIDKEKMPDINQNELMVQVEWNENIHIKENYERCLLFFREIKPLTQENSGLTGQQQFLLNRDNILTPTEARIYIKANNPDRIKKLKPRILKYFAEKHPFAEIKFLPVGTIFDRIFATGEAELTLEYHMTDKMRKIDPETIAGLRHDIKTKTREIPSTPSFQKQINLNIDREKLLLYNIPYESIYQTIRTAFKENKLATLRSQQQYFPILLAGNDKTVSDIINTTLVETSLNDDGNKNKIRLSAFITISESESLKTIVAGKTGEYIDFNFYNPQQPGNIIKSLNNDLDKHNNGEVSFSGSFFSNQKMIKEMMAILFVSIMLMYFILAAQFEDFRQPLIVLLEIPIDIAAALALLILTGHSLNLMSAIGIIVTCGIIINDSILKVDIMNQLRKQGMPLMQAIHEAGRRRLKAILMTSMTSIVCMIPLLFTNDLGSSMEKPLAIATIGGMVIGTPVSLFVVPLVYWYIYNKRKPDSGII